jgi:hypothetical protein
MRTTLRIDDDLLAELRRRAHAQKRSLTELVNRVLRRGLAAGEAKPGPRRRYRERPISMGRPKLELEKALALAAALEDEATLEKLALRK